MDNNYLGTVNITRKITAHIRDSHYELHIGDRRLTLIYDQVLFTLSRLPEMLHDLRDEHEWYVEDIVLRGKEIRALWNTMLAYMRAMGRDTGEYTNKLAVYAEAEYLQATGSCPEKMVPIEEDTL